MEAVTNIDTLKIQIDKEDSIQQYELLKELKEVIGKLDHVFIKYEDRDIGMGRIYREHFIYYNGKRIAGITTGSCRAGSILTKDYRTVFFVAFEFFGLTRYHESDKGSLACLLEICIYINSRDIPFRITAIDVCLDLIGVKASEVLVLVQERQKRIKYNWLTGNPTYKNTTYIEIQHNHMLSQAYTYPKHIKNEWIDKEIVRYECKFYPSFMRKHEKPIRAMTNVLNNYVILYIDNPKVRTNIMMQYNKQLSCHKLPTSRFQHKMDIEYVQEFIDMLKLVSDLFPYDAVAPNRDIEQLQKEDEIKI